MADQIIPLFSTAVNSGEVEDFSSREILRCLEDASLCKQESARPLLRRKASNSNRTNSIA